MQACCVLRPLSLEIAAKQAWNCVHKSAQQFPADRIASLGPAFGETNPYRPAQATPRAVMLTKAVCATPVACVPRGRAFVPSQAPAARPRALPLAARRQGVVVAAVTTQADTKYPGWEAIYRVCATENFVP